MEQTLMLPGLIDCHVHFREPGQTHKEDFESGVRAALAGGVTTVCDMPNTQPPTCTEVALREKIQRAERLRITNHPVFAKASPGRHSPITNFDIRFFFGVTKQEHLKELDEVMKNDELRKYVPGVKLYFGHSTGEQMVDSSVVQDVFKLCAELDLPVVCHCEDEGVIRANEGLGLGLGIAAHSEIRSIEAAVKATTRAIDLARKFGTHVHIAHVSTAHEVKLIRAARRSGVRVTCEVAPHHLFLNTEDYAVLGTLAKVNPPLRSKEHCSALFEGILDGTIDCVASDHAPHTLEEKKVGNPLDAPSGVPGVETTLPLLLSCVFGDGPVDAQGRSRFQVSGFRFQVSDIIRLFFENPNRIFRLGRSKEQGPTITIDPTNEWVIRGKELRSKCGWTPYEGWKVIGKVEH